MVQRVRGLIARCEISLPPGLLIYAGALIALGLWRGWAAPLSWDEQKYYLPAIEYMAARLPSIPLDYPMPMPPFGLVLQAIVYRLTESVMVLRILSTAAMIAVVAIASRLMHAEKPFILVMIGCFPAALLNAFTLKHHSLTLLLCMGALLLWERRRSSRAAILLSLAVLTHQIAVAMIGTLVLLTWSQKRWRDAVILATSALPLTTLMIFWGGLRPPAHHATFTSEPAITGLHAEQVLLLLFVAGAWLAPTINFKWKTFLCALPLAYVFVTLSGVLPAENVYDGFAGPLSSVITALALKSSVLAAVSAAVFVAFGATVCLRRNVPFVIWSVTYALLMLSVPYFFESYYAVYVTVGWILLRQEIASNGRWFPPIAIAAGFGYAVVKLLA
jgi:hypothetical protein